MNMANSNKICEFFASSSGQGCPYGATCNFLHDLSSSRLGLSSHLAADNYNGQFSNSTTGMADQIRQKRPCHYYRRGNCKDGRRCKFSHDGDGPTALTLGAAAHVRHHRPQRSVKNVCKFFANTGACRFGEKCRFAHEHTKNNYPDAKDSHAHDVSDQEQGSSGRESQQDHSSTEVPFEDSASTKITLEGTEEQQHPKWKTRPCRYFASANGCRLGDNCSFLHKATANKSQDLTGNSLTPGSSARPPVNPPVRGLSLESNRADLSEEDQQIARETEIKVLQKRYPQNQEVHREKGGMAYQIKFLPTDPDWPYDVRSLDLQIHFPSLYPNKMMDVHIPEQDNLPETVRRCVLFSIVDWVHARYKNFKKKGRVERVFRPFLRWLDRDLEDIFTDALTHYKKEIVAKAAGIEVIPARHLQAMYLHDDSDSDEEDRQAEETGGGATSVVPALPESLDDSESMKENRPEDCNLQDIEDHGATHEEKQQRSSGYDPTPRGTEVKLKELQLAADSVATLVAISIKMIVRCLRCKEQAEVATPADRLNQLNCGKCNHLMLVKYRPAMMHGFSSILGYLDLEQCLAFDMLLMDCEFVANCMSCNKDNKVGGIPPGQLKSAWCTSCHNKMSIAMEGTQFRQLQPAAIEKVENAHKVATVKAIRNVRDPAIKEGNPLPDNGICKHYKKSFRWLRFPCCGKTYPCDVCHDSKEDHEMKFANRMICGFCCREQPFSAGKPCSACGNSMTAKPTEHWEGGKGCRDVIKMSRGDNKKYANSNKTVSRKAQAKGPQGKKNLKVRHT